MCVNTMPGWKDIGNDLREATLAAHRSGKLVVCSKKCSTVITIIQKLKTSNISFPGLDILTNSPHGLRVPRSENKKNMSSSTFNCTGLMLKLMTEQSEKDCFIFV
ncbi:hypothetical protein GOODEAATRI_017848 [Goodea atripinnis]|uniref:Uncharacterized protein n=1 Tax=Goodea atripinnis TaxID=208336 RepID=A0ABV0N2C6_9TELE